MLSVVLIVVAAPLCGTTSYAFAAKLHRIIPNVSAFASDGGRYVVWQTKEGSPITSWNTVAGVRLTIPEFAGCEKMALRSGEPEPHGADGRFLVHCASGSGEGLIERQGIIEASTGKGFLLPLPYGRPPLGERYLKGAPVNGCTGIGSSRQCVTRIPLLELASGRVIERPAYPPVDLDRTGAPPICAALRRAYMTDVTTKPYSLSAYQYPFLAQPARQSGYVELKRCHGHPLLLAGSGEPTDFQLGGGLLSWDTGGSGAKTLSSYRLSNHEHHAWKLPVLPFTYNGIKSYPRVSGYSVHTANMVFWVATTAEDEEGEAGLPSIVAMKVYAAKL